jgi:hypothetical protein
MAFELERLMQQYGVATPSAAAYGGSTPAERAAYDAYAQEYRRRMGETPMYHQAQFQTGVAPGSPLAAYWSNVLAAPGYAPAPAPVAPPSLPGGGGPVSPGGPPAGGLVPGGDAVGPIAPLPPYVPPEPSPAGIEEDPLGPYVPPEPPPADIPLGPAPELPGGEDPLGPAFEPPALPVEDPLGPAFEPAPTPPSSEPAADDFGPPYIPEAPAEEPYAPVPVMEDEFGPVSPPYEPVPLEPAPALEDPLSPAFEPPYEAPYVPPELPYTPPFAVEEDPLGPAFEPPYMPPAEEPYAPVPVMEDEFGTPQEPYVPVLPGEFGEEPAPYEPVRPDEFGEPLQPAEPAPTPDDERTMQDALSQMLAQYYLAPGSSFWDTLNPFEKDETANMARGGRVRKFERGGLNEMDSGMEEAPAPMLDDDAAALMAKYDVAGAAPQGAPAAAPAPMDMNALMARYLQPGQTSYGAELAAARRRADKETQAFQALLERAMAQPAAAPDKAEMYFRLAAAFAEPGKTGSFAEGVGRAAGAMAEQRKAEREAARAARTQQQQLGLTAAQARMTAAKEDVGTLRQLAGEEMKDKRAIGAQLLKDWVSRNDPVSSAGKQAQDEGLAPGTPEFQKRVREISELAVEKANAQIQATLAGTNVAMGNLALAQTRLAADISRREGESKKLSGPELKLKTETEDTLAAADSALGSLREAYKLNPNAFDTSVPDMAQRKVLEAAGSKDPKLLATRTMENLLGEQALAKLKTTFGSAPTEGERKILMDLQGIGAKSREERAAIMRNAYAALKTARDRQQRRLNEITQGLYRNMTPDSAAAGLD